MRAGRTRAAHVLDHHSLGVASTGSYMVITVIATVTVTVTVTSTTTTARGRTRTPAEEEVAVRLYCLAIRGVDDIPRTATARARARGRGRGKATQVNNNNGKDGTQTPAVLRPLPPDTPRRRTPGWPLRHRRARPAEGVPPAAGRQPPGLPPLGPDRHDG